MTPAVFLDRDGVIIEEKHHLFKKEDIQLIPGSDKAISILNRQGYKVIIISNQSVVARGLCTLQDVVDVNNLLLDKLNKSGAKIDRVYFCPHHPTEGNNPEYTRKCECRKPNIGMIAQAKNELGIDLSRSFVVGDKMIDIEAGVKAGCRTILVETGYGGRERCSGGIYSDFFEMNLLDAARRIISK